MKLHVFPLHQILVLVFIETQSKGLDSDDESDAYDPAKNKKKSATQINVKKSKW